MARKQCLLLLSIQMVILPLNNALLPSITITSIQITEEELHERLVLAQVNARKWIIVTPDLDMHAETLTCPPLTGIQVLNEARALPGGIAAINVHRFHVGGRRGAWFDEADLVRLKREARACGVGARLRGGGHG